MKTYCVVSLLSGALLFSLPTAQANPIYLDGSSAVALLNGNVVVGTSTFYAPGQSVAAAPSGLAIGSLVMSSSASLAKFGYFSLPASSAFNSLSVAGPQVSAPAVNLLAAAAVTEAPEPSATLFLLGGLPLFAFLKRRRQNRTR